ncbi:aldose 1-epimerase family protein [Atopococcus tabaci]|uniref:aldose 1-epimerase family protein n=1 Tax=Atopococcus tabaci TaxID=269774 RepID=UPI0024099316|nr:aldose 1-epimerase family protein [Atopococcus tabaci]
MRHRIENEWIAAEIETKGAELKSLRNKETNREYMWQGDPVYWGRTAPVLFPIVGKLKEDKYQLNGKEYEMTQHGFGRDKEFELIEQQDDRLVFQLTSDSQTKEHYPYDFRLRIRYTLRQNAIEVGYEVQNVNNEDMYFSIGGHPGFQVPMTKETAFEDYVVSVNPKEERERIPLNGPYADIEKVRIDDSVSEELKLKHSLFDQDALIYRMEGQNEVTIHSHQHEHFVRVSFSGFPYVGIWTPPAKKAPFLCIEPWHGLADTVEASGELSQKMGIRSLEPGSTFQTSYQIEVG